EPPRAELPREELRQRLPAALPARAFDAVLDGLRARGLVAIAGEAVRRPATTPGPAMTPLEAELASRFASWALEPPRPKEVPAAVGKPEPAVRTALDKLVAARRLVKVKPDLYVDADTIAALKAKLLAYLDAHREITPQAWKDLTGTSRKFSIPLAEYFDAEKVTLRVGEIRRRR
ncbi:MAG TPA: SelB C-terminal domain-containing protein, partial [Gaiellaceae bacterium]|nr:SelB C-terminal domain-containing protein [Gaiellaceae bacterium]